MNIFKKKKHSNGLREIYIVGKKILEYRRAPTLVPIQNTPLHIHRIKQLNQEFIPLVFHWDKIWHEYLAKHQLPELLQSLTEGMDDISNAYINKFIQLINLLEYKNDIQVSPAFSWTPRDFEYALRFEEYNNIEQYSDDEAFIHSNKYGPIDLPEDILQKINGHDIIDGGAYTGDTAVLFHQLFPESNIYGLNPNLQTISFSQVESKNYRSHHSSPYPPADLVLNVKHLPCIPMTILMQVHH